MDDQADQAGHDLGYAIYHQLVYDLHESTWRSRRAFNTFSPLLHPVAPSHCAVKPADAHLAHSHREHDDHVVDSLVPATYGYIRSIRPHVAHLVRHLPTLASVARLSTELARPSLHVTATTSRHDPITGNLLTFGRVSDLATRRTFHVAAFPSSPWATSICLMQVQLQKQGWEQNKSVWVDIPRLSGESGAWDARQPIRQLSFSHRLDETHALTPYLAVRTTLAVHILHLSVRKGTSSWNHLHASPSRFRIVPTHSLSLDALQGVPPADVAFNPFYDKQFATIDQHGTWRIWDMSYQTAGDQGRPLQVCNGATSQHSVVDSAAQDKVLDDGWGRVAWIGTSSTLISASRRAIAIHDVASKPIRLTCPDLGSVESPCWILDLQTNLSAHPTVFVLTTTEMICLHVYPLDYSDSDGLDRAGARILFRAFHYRDPADISLHMSLSLDGQDVVVLLKSSLTSMATVQRCTFVETASIPFLCMSDPVPVTLPEHPSVHSRPYRSISLRLHAAEYGEHLKGASGPGQIYRDSSVRFYVMTMLAEDMSVVEKIYCAQTGSVVPRTDILAPNWHSRVTHGALRLHDNRFIIDEDHLTEHVDRAVDLAESVEQPMFSRQWPFKSGRKNWTMIYEKSYRQTTKTDRDEVQDLSHAVENIKRHTQDSNKANVEGISTLYDICKGQISVGDIDEATVSFQNLFVDETAGGDDQDVDMYGLPGENGDTGKVSPSALADSSVLGVAVGANAQPSLMGVYDSIMTRWLAPLSPRVPGRVRLAKEQLARRAAAEICLSSYGLKARVLPATQEEEHQWSAETYPSQQSSFLGSSQSRGTFPTPSPTATPSLTTATSLSSHPSTMASPEYLALQQYTSFSPDKTGPAPLSRRLANKLAHWSVGEDPAQYDWLSVKRRQDKEVEEEETLTPRERARLKKRAEKHLRKQRRETLKAASMHLASSQAPEIFSASQPATVSKKRPRAPSGAADTISQGFMLSSSQPTQSQTLQLPIGQVERGRHGGRAQPPKKKKKRNEGF